MSDGDTRVALVTGATRGIGRDVSRLLAAAGLAVYVSGRDAGAAALVAGEIGDSGDVRALPLGLDVADPASVTAYAAALGEAAGRLDVLVNNAAAFVDWNETTGAADLDAARRVFDTNLFGTWALTQALLPLLRAAPAGRIVNVSSGAGSHGDEQFGLGVRGGRAASYGISKAAVNALTTSLAAELDGTPLLVNAVCPGLTATFEGGEAMGARPVADGAASVVWATLLPDGGPSGGFFRDGEPLPY